MQLNCLYIFATTNQNAILKYDNNEMLYKYKAVVRLKFPKSKLHRRAANLLLGYVQLQKLQPFKICLSKPCVTCVYSL